MAEEENHALREALRIALVAADAAGDTLIAARIADCLWLMSRRAERR